MSMVRYHHPPSDNGFTSPPSDRVNWKWRQHTFKSKYENITSVYCFAILIKFSIPHYIKAVHNKHVPLQFLHVLIFYAQCHRNNFSFEDSETSFFIITDGLIKGLSYFIHLFFHIFLIRYPAIFLHSKSKINIIKGKIFLQFSISAYRLHMAINLIWHFLKLTR